MSLLKVYKIIETFYKRLRRQQRCQVKIDTAEALGNKTKAKHHKKKLKKYIRATERARIDKNNIKK